MVIFYVITNFILLCNQKVLFEHMVCGSHCLDQGNVMSRFNWVINILFPAFIIIFGSIFLLIHVLWSRREMQRNLRNWSKNWKMIVQLLGIASLYIIIWIPLSIITLISTFHSDLETTVHVEDYFFFLTYLCEMTVPIGALFCCPEIIRRFQRRLRTNSIASVTMGPSSMN